MHKAHTARLREECSDQSFVFTNGGDLWRVRGITPDYSPLPRLPRRHKYSGAVLVSTCSRCKGLSMYSATTLL
jgi:hypothetical protein